MNNEIIKLFQGQMDVMYGLLLERIIEEGARVAVEISMHQRDKHNGYWDPTYYLENKKKQGEKISELCKKMEENRKKINELIKANENGKEVKDWNFFKDGSIDSMNMEPK